jgi:hypothetical protein
LDLNEKKIIRIHNTGFYPHKIANLRGMMSGCSVADPGCFIPDPDPTIAPSRIWIPDPGDKKAPDPGSDLFLYKGY